LKKELTILENNKNIFKINLDARLIKNSIALGIQLSKNMHTLRPSRDDKNMYNFYYITFLVVKIKITICFQLGFFK